MNERIKQLALQSQLVYETTDGKVYNSWEDYVDLTEYVEKFAELIVQECAQHALDFNTNIQSLPDKVMRGNLYRVLDYIKDRMGVK